MKRKIFGAILLLLSVNIQAYEVWNYYVNGVRSSLWEANKSAVSLKLISDVNIVNVLYNQTNGTVYDLFEAALLSQDLMDFYNKIYQAAPLVAQAFEDFSDILNEHIDQHQRSALLKASKIYAMLSDSNQRSIFLDTLVAPVANEEKLLQLGFDLLELAAIESISSLEVKILRISNSFKHVFQNLPNIQDSYEINIQEMLSLVESNGAPGKKRINLLAHSEGNSFALRLAGDLEDYGHAVKVVHVASPEGEVYGDSPYVTLKEDMAHWLFLGSLPSNMTNYTATDRQVEGLVRWLGPISQLFTITADINSEKYGDPLGHNFIKSYLHRESEADDTGAVISLYYKANYVSLSKIRFPGEPLEYEKSISLGDIVDGFYDSDEMSKYRSGRYARHYNLSVPSCRKVQIDLVAERSTDAYLYIHANGILVGKDDDSYGNRSSRIIMDLAPGDYEIEATTYSSGRSGIFTLLTYDLGPGNCYEQESDIYIVDTSLSTFTALAGEEIRAFSSQCYSGTQTVSNLGAYPKLGYYLSTNSTWGSSDIYLDYDSSSIGSDDLCDGESEYLTIPSNTPAGNYYILFVADYDNQVSESDENNNVVAEPISIDALGDSGGDDIYLTSSSVSDSTPARGQQIRIRTRVNYEGSKTTDQLGTIYTSYYLITSNGTTYLDRDVSSIGIDDLVDGESEYVTIPANAPVGLAYIEIKADDRNGVESINETDEDNNIALISINIH
jgi:hypothetical protein